MMTQGFHTNSYKKIFIFWIPLAATWLMMSVEGPFLAAIIARLADPKYNLAAYGVAFSFALLIEAPIIMIMSAATALSRDKDSFNKLRKFTFFLNGSLTLIMIVGLIPNIFYFLTLDLIGLPREVAELTHTACIILIPWPGAIGYRRFYQGVMIRSNLTRKVAYGTIIRLASMSITALSLFLLTDLNGAAVGASALSVGVVLEGLSSRFMATSAIKHISSLKSSTEIKIKKMSYGFIAKFYYPLALTSILALGVHPIVTFFMGQSRMALESLAVLPVINSLVFIFRSIGLSYQEVGIALIGDKNEGYIPLRTFAIFLGISVFLILSFIAFTPLSTFWFQSISGLSPELADFALLPTRILAFIPGLTVLLSFQRAVLVSNSKTTPITIATSLEVTTIVIILIISIKFLDVIGVTAAAIALILGRLTANSYLFFPYLRVLK